ncbi:MAG: hypothetical protein GXP24_10330 [Planctomycetes bacterium]|nr:hypothetical protein [Planctomycetota bacterium]
MMTVTRRGTNVALALVCGLCAGTAMCFQTAHGQVRYEEKNGIRYQVTQSQAPVTVMQNRQQTVYAQQLTTNTLNHQQLYCVPNTSYQWDSRLHGRWNPFITPYWSYNLRPVTSWSTQVANVQIPVNQVAWVPQTKTVQVPVTAYRPSETWVAMNTTSAPSTGLATARPLSSSPSATLAARSGVALGGVAMESDPPRQSTGGGWQSSSTAGKQY